MANRQVFPGKAAGERRRYQSQCEEASMGANYRALQDMKAVFKVDWFQG